MKKSVAIFMSAIILLTVVCNAFASDTANRVFADAVTVESGESVSIPVKIENNGGFMGFAVHVTYDAEVFKPVSVTKGSVLSGLFNDSITTSKTNSFKVVCSETENVTENGEIFTLRFDVTENVSGRYEIGLSYSPQDTFDENWNNVVFACEDIEVVVTENGTTAPTTKPTETETTVIQTIVSTTQKIEGTTGQQITEPDDEVTTTQPASEETTTNPFVTDPDVRPKLTSEMLREWVDSLASPWNWILKAPFYFAAFIVGLFE